MRRALATAAAQQIPERKSSSKFSEKLAAGPDLGDFISASTKLTPEEALELKETSESSATTGAAVRRKKYACALVTATRSKVNNITLSPGTSASLHGSKPKSPSAKTLPASKKTSAASTSTQSAKKPAVQTLANAGVVANQKPQQQPSCSWVTNALEDVASVP